MAYKQQNFFFTVPEDGNFDTREPLLLGSGEGPLLVIDFSLRPYLAEGTRVLSGSLL